MSVAALGAAVVLAACGGTSSRAATSASTTQTAPVATAVAATTCAKSAALTEGPYWKAGSPARWNLRRAGVKGKALLMTGKVLGTDCKPIAGAAIDIWQADGEGNYDNAGYRLRGHQTSAADGSWKLRTVVPGLYPGRTEHIHVKVTPPGGSTVTTQLFFPGVSQNDEDGIYVPSMLVKHFRKTTSGYKASFTFVVGA